MDITAAAIATLISSSISTLVALWVNSDNKFKSLKDRLEGIIKISIQYPYLESPKFTSTWNDNLGNDDEAYVRYENYCNLVFNYLSDVCDYYQYNEAKIQNFINIKSWIRLHKDCWKNPSTLHENVDSYSEKFVNLIEKYTK